MTITNIKLPTSIPVGWLVFATEMADGIVKVQVRSEDFMSDQEYTVEMPLGTVIALAVETHTHCRELAGEKPT